MSSGGTTYHSCQAYTNITMESGDLIGHTATSLPFDFGSYDYRITPLSFISPARKYSDKMYTVCPIDYFTDSNKSAMQALLGQGSGAHFRVTPPICGGVNFDIAGTASGDWYQLGWADIPEDAHLALVVDNIFAPRQTISYGNNTLP